MASQKPPLGILVIYGALSAALVFAYQEPILAIATKIYLATWEILTNAPYVLIKDPYFQTGYPYLDAILALLLVGATIIVILDITIFFFERASRAAEDEARIPELAPRVKWKTFKLLIVAAVAITVLVNLLRYEHRRQKLDFIEVLGDKGRRNIYIWEPSEFIQDLPGFIKHLVDTGVNPYFYDRIPKALLRRYPWLPADSSRLASVWGYFKLLVDSSRRLWWSRQWILGWFAWSVWVRVECGNRNIGRSKAVGFIWLGYLLSLAGAQCLFFALLLLCPRVEGPPLLPEEKKVHGHAIQEGVAVSVLYIALAWEADTRKELPPRTMFLFSTVQATLIAVPSLLIVWMEVTTRSANPVAGRVLHLKRLWCGISIYSVTMHVWNSCWAFLEVNGSSWLGHFNRWGGQLNWFVPWRDESYPPVQGLRHFDSAILETLGDHSWINAVGWDVVLSVIALCIWAVLSSASARDMLRCSLMPTLEDETEDVVASEPPRTRRGRGRPAKTYQDAQVPGRSLGRGRPARADLATGASDGGYLFKVLSPYLSRRRNMLHAGARRGADAGPAEEDQSFSAQHEMEDVAGEAEAAGLTWCLWVLGGLGTASAAVFGAESEI